jgi:hypothetical protein
LIFTSAMIFSQVSSSLASHLRAASGDSLGNGRIACFLSASMVAGRLSASLAAFCSAATTWSGVPVRAKMPSQ